MARLAKILIFIGLSMRGLVLVLMAFYGLFSPISVEASFTSAISSLFANTTEASDTANNESSIRTTTSQNVALLSAVATSNPKLNASDLVDLNIVANSALMAESGPLGTILDVEESDGYTDTISVYIVKKGDTLSEIAQMFDVSVNTIVWGNDLKGPKDIKIGQELIILPVSGIKYTIKKNDTIASIAKKHKGDADEILKFNNIENGSKLAIGDEIIIPNGEMVAPAPTVARSGTSKVVKTYIDETINSLAYYIRPVVNGRKTQGFHGKNGVDIAPGCRCVGKEPLLASASGRVLIAKTGGWNGGYGNYVVIDHSNGTQTLYAHMHTVSVSAGQQVSQGAVVGTIGNSGNSTGPHVHFEIRGARNPF